MRIVLVDASRIVRRIIAGLLEARGHTAHAFADGPEALLFIKSNEQVDALITSAELASMSGLEMCWEARLLSSCRRPIHIILMSSNYDRHKLTEALDSGADDFIAKPVVAEELYARLRAAERMCAMQRELIKLASTDPLTGLLNRRSFFERALGALAEEGGQPLCAAIMDIDHFKSVNDAHGHHIGDEVLCEVAATVTQVTDFVGRFGGEEFAFICQHRPYGEVYELVEAQRLRIAALEFAGGNGPFRITCSFGMAERHEQDTIDSLLRKADVALYAAKAGGRNRVVKFEPHLHAAKCGSGSNKIRTEARRTAGKIELSELAKPLGH
jgi:two-component system cell cycle response regulator